MEHKAPGLLALVAGVALLCLPGCGGSPDVIEAEGAKVVTIRPAWVDKVPLEEGYLHAVGAHGKSMFVDARAKAAERARAELALSLQATVSVLIVDYFVSNGYSGGKEELFSEVSRSVSDLTLEQAQVLEYWVDSEDGTTYALLKMPIKPNAKRIGKLAGDLAKDKGGLKKPVRLTAEEIEAKAQKALAELDKETSNK